MCTADSANYLDLVDNLEKIDAIPVLMNRIKINSHNRKSLR